MVGRMKFKFIALTLAMLLAMPLTVLNASGYGQQHETVLELGNLTTAPKVQDADGYAVSVAAGETKAIYFDALEYQGKPTRVYAWLISRIIEFHNEPSATD